MFLRHWTFAKAIAQDPGDTRWQRFRTYWRIAKNADKPDPFFPNVTLRQRYRNLHEATELVAAAKRNAAILQLPECQEWWKEFMFDKDRWIRVPGAVIRSGKPGSPTAHHFYVEVRGETVYHLPHPPKECECINLHAAKQLLT